MKHVSFYTFLRSLSVQSQTISSDFHQMQEQSTEPCIVSDPRTNVQIMNCSASINGNFTLQSLLLNGKREFCSIRMVNISLNTD